MSRTVGLVLPKEKKGKTPEKSDDAADQNQKEQETPKTPASKE